MQTGITFLKFLDFKFLEGTKQDVEQIEVPMLQRDYAQGRKSQEGIATKFLEALFQVLEGKKPTLHLDLVYGYQEGLVFKLIDGQQRVTTLWLLHFLLYRKANQLEKIKDRLSHFTYHTRESSKEFCEKILEEDLSLAQPPSVVISQNEGSFGDVGDLENDPTIKAMIHMLDLIYDRLKNKDTKELEGCLNNLEKISFSVIDMRQFKLGDDLYIKLNARGKLLSKFEKLKAFIEQADIDSKWLLALDNRWSDYFFESTKAEAFDQRFFHFLHYANAFFALQTQGEDLDKIFSTERNIDEDNLYRFLQEEENLKVLSQTIDLLPKCQKLKLLTINGPGFFEAQREGRKDQKTQEPRLEHKKIAYFFALLALSQVYQEECPDKSLQDYAKVCKHFIENHPLDSNADLKGFFGLFQAIIAGITNKQGFYAFLAKTKTHSFHRLFSLEQRKAQLIYSNEAWEEIFNVTSDHEYLVGYVGFLLDFSQVEGQQENLQNFHTYANLTIEILNKFFLEPSGGYPLSLFQRVLLCFGDYSIEATNNFFGNRYKMGMFRYRQLIFKLFEKEPFEPQKHPKNSFHKLLDNLLSATQPTLQAKMLGILERYTKHQGQQLIGISWQLTDRFWWEQLLLQQEDLFGFINKEESKECGRIYFLKDNAKRQKSHPYAKAYLLPAKKYSEKTVDLLGYALHDYLRSQPMKNLDAEYENGKQVRQFVLNGFAIFADSQISSITLESIEDKQPPIKIKIPINLKSGTDVFKELQRVAAEIKKVAES